MANQFLPDLDDDGFADVESLHHRLQRRRLWMGMTAAVLSVALHVFIAMRLPAFALPHDWEQVKDDLHQAFKVSTVSAVPRAAESERPEAATSLKPGPGFNVKADAITLKRMVDEVKLAPQPLPSGALEQSAGAPPTPNAPRAESWSPREEILKVEDRLVREEIPDRPRRLIPDVNRIKGAADVTLPMEAPHKVGTGTELSDAARQSVAEARPPSVKAADTQWERLEELLKSAPGPVLGSGAAEAGGRRAPETVALLPPPSGEPLKPIEGLLKATLSVYSPKTDPDYLYAKVDIKRAGADAMPVLPKDILFIQDCSASITEQRLAFCREGLLRCLAQLPPRDRFNVVEFRDTPRRCFADWAPAHAANLEAGRTFVRAMESRGNTDIYASLRELLSMDRKPVRPVVVILISDGLPTAGMRDSAEIIAAFTRENSGSVSVFALATFDQANLYLLDMLSYMNRGDSVAARRGRWSIPDVMDGQVVGVSRPVLSDMHFRFSSPGAEMVPSLTPNLYLDRSLVLYGRFPKKADRVVFQVVGRSGEQGCDMVFDLKMAEAAAGDAAIREEWAWHKVYGLIGEHTRTRDPALIREIQRVSASYGLQVPYADELK
jgi:hypothetical protein